MRLSCVITSIVVVVSIVCSNGDDTADVFTATAMNYVAEGDIALGSGDQKNSLAFYRAAVRLSPSNSDYWIKLGTVEYGLNELEKSKSRFERVLNLDPKSSTAKYYLKQIEGKLMKKTSVCFDDSCDETDEDDEVVYSPIPEYGSDIWESSSEGYRIKEFETLSMQPFIARQSLTHMHWNIPYFSLDSLQSVAGSVVVDFYPQNMLNRPEKTFNVPLSEALDFLQFPEGAYLSVDISEPGTYIQCNLNSSLWKEAQSKGNVGLAPYYVNNLEMFFSELASSDSNDAASRTLVQQLSEYFDVTTHWNMLLIGEKGSGMFEHQDALPVGSWQAQISGSKHFKICAPAQKKEGERSSAATVASDGSSAINSDSAANESDDKADDVRGPCMEGTSSAGDFLYYPPHYFHQTLNTEGPSVALSGTLILERNKQEFKDLLIRECGPLKEKNYQFTKEFCQFILQHHK